MTANTCQDYPQEVDKLVELQWKFGICKVVDLDESESSVFVGGSSDKPVFAGIFHKSALLKACDKFVSEVDKRYRTQPIKD